jgi:glycosyltransferase involved in cell wall biosynthesis
MSESVPMVSVVMATYAGDRLDFLQEAVASIQAQTHEKWELIVAADGPLTEETQQFLDALAAEDGRVRLVGLEVNAGPGAVRNMAIAQARGEFVAILDADDVAEANRLKRQIAFLKETGADAAGSCYRLVDEAGAILGEKHVPLTAKAIRHWAPILNPIGNSTVMARTSVLQETPYPENTRYGEDYGLWVALLRKGHRLENQGDLLIRFRTATDFLQRRRGGTQARSDFMNKLHALSLVAPWWWPPMALGAILVIGVRMLPAPLLRIAYGVARLTGFVRTR